MKKYHIKHLSKTQIAKAYGVDLRILTQWMAPYLEKIGEPRGRYYTPKQVRMIFIHIGYPDTDRLMEL